MAKHDRYDARLDGLVVERRTEFAPELAGHLSEDDRARLADELHADPAAAASLRYERAHTGFTRVITATVEDLGRLADS
ncbi:MAG: hypothetical protein AAF907_12315 [Planctomycetota bacterium]